MATTKTGTAIDASGNAINISVTSLTNGSLADANDVMATLNDIETDVEGHSHSLDGAVGWDSLLASFRPPDTGDSSNRYRILTGFKTGTVLSGGTAQATITFASDADQGSLNFVGGDTPRFIASIVSGTVECNATVKSCSTVSAVLVVTEINGGASSVGIDIYWMAFGRVA